MKWTTLCGALIASLAMSGPAQAGHFDGIFGSSKSCGCDEDCQPECCKPQIVRPCEPSVHTYQRKCSDIKPPCCDDSCCDPCAPAKCCAPGDAANGCAPNGDAAKCCAPNGDAAKCCAPNGDAAKCCAPAAKCCAPNGDCCDSGCESDCCESGDPCEIANLIYESQTACYAKDRKRAIHKLSDFYNCKCNPEIMCALIYALNDCDERVRAKAADEIGDQLRKNPCCCCEKVVGALTCALADCDKKVRRQAEEALEACGYEVVDGCCDDGCCDDGCNGHCGTTAPAADAPAEAPAEADPAPVPPDESAAEDAPEAYFPSRIPARQTQTRSSERRTLANLFGLRR